VRLLARAREAGHAPEDTFIWGYSQDHVGYILAPEQDDWAMGGTEGTTTFWGWKQGARLLDATSALLRGLDGPDQPPADEFAVNYTYGLIPSVPAPVTPSLNAGMAVLEPTDIERFEVTRFAWEGGDPVVDLPQTTLLRCASDGEDCVPARRRNGEVIDSYFEMHLGYRLANLQHLWQVEFEAPLDWPAGTYRFEVKGHAQQLALAEYSVRSRAFTVAPSPTLQLSAPQRVGDAVEVTLAYAARPDTYRLIDAQVRADVAAPVRSGRVRFSLNGNSVTAERPRLEVRDEQLVAVYSAALSGDVASFSVSGEDLYGNRTPDP